MSFKENLLNKSNSYNYYKETTESLSLENKELKEIINQLKKDLENKDKNISLLKEEIKLLNDKNDHEIEFLDSVSNKINTILSDSFNRFNDYKRITAKNDKFYRQINNELKYAFVFNDTIKESEWLIKKDFSLVNSAANYSFMYSLYRILNDAEPKNILELGMGQTTKLTSQFANYFNDCKLTVLEGDEIWIENFAEQLVISENIHICHMDLENVTIDGTLNTRFKGVLDIVADDKFDLVIIDGPQGFVVENGVSKELDYSRSNVLELIPKNLAEDFIIIIDDFNRQGEQNTMSIVKELLSREGIEFYEYSCTGLKRQYVICTEKYRYVTWI
ncbi:hypothetical protein [uncultured Methanobrevibacter sp.]|jgi:hypothetical protein|uniref:hypothetical protein n=1 Tax=uncultured Methanobrevibacter sp. TaxID=253161 RepID=UPI0025E314CB|nr:hypothetical protein [uncultured Methanobrevibacter sp.]